MWPVGLLLILGPLVTLHELGHYLVGRWFGVGAKAFSVGFGKELVGFDDSRGTRWKISALPLGGYVQFKGDMNAASQPPADDDDATFGMATRGALAEDDDRHVVGNSFHAAELWKRALIVFAGPAMNIIITIAIFAGFNMLYGELDAPAQVAGFSEQSAGREAGLEVGDTIAAIDGAPVESFMEVRQTVFMYPGRAIELTVDRGGDTLTIPVTLEDRTVTDRFGNESRIGLLGVLGADSERITYGPVAAVGRAGEQTVELLDMMITGIGQLFIGERSIRELGGPIKIAKYSGEQLSLGPEAFVNFAALISINLAFINLLPIPTLDGGHLAFYAAEAVRRKPVGPRGQEWAFRIGLSLVLMLMLFVTINDIVSLPIFGS